MDLSPAFALDTRPRDFSAKLPRRRLRTVGGHHRLRLRGRRLAALLAVIAVPALAAPDGWQGFDIGNAGRSEARLDPMPFERSGDSFPGSAFYYLAPDPVPQIGEGIHSDADGAMGAIDPSVGPLARALRVDNSGVDRTRALQCLTAAIYYEAASEPDQGQRAVAQVVLNRVAHPSFPNTVCGVVYQGSERTTGCQFSFTCDGSLARVPSRFFWQRAMLTAQAALSGYVEPSVGLATHYHTIAVHPAWDRDMNHIRTIGAHMFFRWKSRAGDAANFRFAYFGGEPVAAPHARSAAADAASDPSLDPLALARAFEAGLKTAPATGTPAHSDAAPGPVHAGPTPAYSADIERQGGDSRYRGDRLPGGQQVRPEYENSGRWIAQPGT